MESTNSVQVTRFYAGEITAMANRCERFAGILGRRYPEVGDELRRIADELDALARRLENR